MPRPPSDNTEQVSFKVSPSLVRRAKRVAKKWGRGATRTAVLRAGLERGVRELEDEAGKEEP